MKSSLAIYEKCLRTADARSTREKVKARAKARAKAKAKAKARRRGRGREKGRGKASGKGREKAKEEASGRVAEATSNQRRKENPETKRPRSPIITIYGRITLDSTPFEVTSIAFTVAPWLASPPKRARPSSERAKRGRAAVVATTRSTAAPS